MKKMKKITCFVIMPFSDTEFQRNGKEVTVTSEEWTYIFNQWIKKAVESFSENVICKRSPLAPGNFIKGIVEDIADSDITIADLTGGKPNVYYELGIRHSLRNGTIIISQNFNDLPSDLKSYHCFEYAYTNESFKYDSSYNKFEKSIHKYINYILNKNYPSDNPVSDYLELDKFKNQKVEDLKESRLFFENSVVLKTSDGFAVIPLDEIVYLKAEGAYTAVFFENEMRHILSKPLKTVLSEINKKSIIRIHRSFAVNKNKITLIKRNNVVLKNNYKIPVSNRFKVVLGF